MKRIIITLFTVIAIVLAISGCSQTRLLYRVNIQQGNIVTADLVRQLRVGMSKDAVCEVLGAPVLVDTFNNNRWTYIYTYKPGSKGKYIERNLVIYFKCDRVSRVKVSNIE